MQLIDTFVFATKLLPKFQASSHILCLNSRVCVWPGEKPWRLVFLLCGLYLVYLQDQFDTIDFSDNDVRKLDGFPLLHRLKSLLLNNNRIV